MVMTFCSELGQSLANQFVALILDNEVTVSHFVTSPPLPWNRLIQHDGKFQIGAEYPTLLTSQQARFEMRNWDQVSLPAIMRALAALDDSVDYVVFGNNSGQGLPLAKSLRSDLIGERGAVIYASSLPEIDAYRRLGYCAFFPRSETVAHLIRLAESARRPLELCFINTIQHNELNYHDP
jgi:hypothetical protein